MGERNRNMFVLMIVIMFILFLSLISIIFNLTGALFISEFLVLLIFLLSGTILAALICSRKEWIWKGLLIFFGANLINLGFLLLADAGFSRIILPLTVGTAGFIISMTRPTAKKELNAVKNDEYKDKAEEAQDNRDELKKKVEDIKVNFSPGKYVASETGKKFHIPKCDFAKKINKNKIVWLDDKADAKKKGYMPCKCIK